MKLEIIRSAGYADCRTRSLYAMNIIDNLQMCKVASGIPWIGICSHIDANLIRFYCITDQFIRFGFRFGIRVLELHLVNWRIVTGIKIMTQFTRIL